MSNFILQRHWQATTPTENLPDNNMVAQADAAAKRETKTRATKLEEGYQNFQLIDADGISTITTFFNRRPREAALKAATRGHTNIVLREPLNAKKNEYRMHHFEGKTVPIPEDKMREYEKKYNKTKRPHVHRTGMSKIAASVLRLERQKISHPDDASDLQAKFDERQLKAEEKLKRQRKAAAAKKRAEKKAAAGGSTSAASSKAAGAKRKRSAKSATSAKSAKSSKSATKKAAPSKKAAAAAGKKAAPAKKAGKSASSKASAKKAVAPASKKAAAAKTKAAKAAPAKKASGSNKSAKSAGKAPTAKKARK